MPNLVDRFGIVEQIANFFTERERSPNLVISPLRWNRLDGTGSLEQLATVQKCLCLSLPVFYRLQAGAIW
ncbi:hypothetical protein H6F51_07700 [Cyanobacteria bacterium FACHB-DQ100]|nr:hypothetical protein [Cyanobacteria bacterium FACHB-DQ100]